MHSVPLGPALRVTTIVVGTARGVPAARGVDLLNEAWDGLGIRALDVTDAQADGERPAERFLEDRQPEEVTVLAGVGGVVGRDRGSDLSPGRLDRDIAAAVRRLGRVDGVWLRGADAETPLEATLTAVAEAVEAGRLRAYGLSGVDVWTLDQAMSAADRAGLPRPGWVRNRMNLLERDDQRDLAPLTVSEGLGLTPRAPFAHGRLTDRHVAAEEAEEVRVRAGQARVAAADDALDRLIPLRDLARDRDVSTEALALAWLLAVQGVSAPIVAPAAAAEWDAVHEALAFALDPEDRERIDDLFA